MLRLMGTCSNSCAAVASKACRDWGKKGLEGKPAALINLMRKRGLEMPIIILVRRKRFEDSFEARRLRLARRAKRTQDEAETDGYRGMLDKRRAHREAIS
jgi:hypothetical protein